MADIKARLLEAIGGFKAPQHKKEGLNEFEATEGKDGKMNVRDTDVHARLDAIEQKLTGSFVNLIKEDISIPSDGIGIITTQVFNDSIKAFSIMISADSDEKYRLYHQSRIKRADGSTTIANEYLEFENNKQIVINYNKPEMKRKTQEVRFYLFNEGLADYNYTVEINGVT